MEPDQPDRRICEHCCTSYQYGPETMVYMFGDRPEYDYTLTVCPEPTCRVSRVILGVGKELFESLHPSVNVVRNPKVSQGHIARALTGLDTCQIRSDSFDRDLRLIILAESAKSLFPQPEDE